MKEELWITPQQVINFHGLKPQHLNISKNDEHADDKLDAILEDWIQQSQDLINRYCNRKFNSDTVDGAIRNVCLRLTSNMVALAVQRRDNPIIKVNDWTIQSLGSDIFTDDLKDDLKPFVNDSTNNYDAIGVYAITGEGLWK
jgi:hypothetical protein